MQIDDGKDNAFNRGDPASSLISYSNNELQGVSRGHSSDDNLGNQKVAKDRTVNKLEYCLMESENSNTSREEYHRY